MPDRLYISSRSPPTMAELEQNNELIVYIYFLCSLPLFEFLAAGETIIPGGKMAKVHPNTEEYCIPGVEVAGDRKDKSRVLTVWRKSLLFSCSGFTVFDDEGNLVFRVDNYGSGRAGEVVLMDAAGKPLLTVRRKKLSLGEHWKIYNGEDAVNPVYSVKKQYSKAALAHVVACRRRGSCGAAGYEVEGSYARRSCTVYDERRRPVAKVQRKEAVGGVGFGDDVYRLVVRPATDACLAMAVVVVLDQMFG